MRLIAVLAAALALFACNAHTGKTTYVYGSGQGSATIGAYDLGLNSHREAVLGR